MYAYSGQRGLPAAASWLKVAVLLVIVACLVAPHVECTTSQMFYPNGRYGRRSDPTFEAAVAEQEATDGNAILNGVTRTGAQLSCTYLGIGELFQCSLRSSMDSYRLAAMNNLKAKA